MNIFQEAWMLMKAIDLNDFNMDDILGDVSFGNQKKPYHDVIYRYLTENPHGMRELDKIKARRIDYDLEGVDLPDYQPQTMWSREDEAKQMFGGSPLDVKDWQFLSSPGKMINRTFSLPTHICMTGGVLREKLGTVCTDCYAHNPNSKYAFNPAQQKLMRNLDAITTNDAVEWATQFADVVPKETANYPVFRFHDSGEWLSPEHISMYVDIAKKNPKTLFWIPTREWEMLKKVFDARGYDIPNNFVPRVSLPYVNQTLDNEENERRGVPLLDEKLVDLLEEFKPERQKQDPNRPIIDYSTVIDRPEYKSSKSSLLCPSSNPVTQSGKCLDNQCMACHLPKVRTIDYFKHK